jgi:hypothetical protein
VKTDVIPALIISNNDNEVGALLLWDQTGCGHVARIRCIVKEAAAAAAAAAEAEAAAAAATATIVCLV